MCSPVIVELEGDLKFQSPANGRLDPRHRAQVIKVILYRMLALEAINDLLFFELPLLIIRSVEDVVHDRSFQLS